MPKDVPARTLGSSSVQAGTPLAPRRGKHSEGGHELGVLAGLAALSLDALSSVAYGPEAMLLVLVTAGAAGLQYVVPLTLVIVGMLALLTLSYTQVIAAHPDGGGSYAVGKSELGRPSRRSLTTCCWWPWSGC